mgnify:CR=1 FL=1
MKDKKKVAAIIEELKAQMTTQYEISVVEECEILLGEEWRDVEGYEGLYQVSDLGRVRSFHNQYGRILKPIVTSHGYAQVTLAKNGTMRSRHIHMLVAKAFIPNPENKPQVNHIDGNPMNNRLENLEWVTSQENIRHAYRTGLAKSGADRKNARFTEDQVRYIRRVYKKGDPEFGMAALGKKFGVNIQVIWGVIHHRTYNNVK